MPILNDRSLEDVKTTLDQTIKEISDLRSDRVCLWVALNDLLKTIELHRWKCNPDERDTIAVAKIFCDRFNWVNPSK